MNNFSDIDIHDPQWAQKFTDKWFDKCKELKIDPIEGFMKMLNGIIKQNDDEISLNE